MGGRGRGGGLVVVGTEEMVELGGRGEERSEKKAGWIYRVHARDAR